MEVVVSIPFFTLSNVDVQFAKKKLTWRTYIIKKALPTTCRVEIINQKEFANTAYNENVKGFIVHVSLLKLRISIHAAKEA